MSTDKCFALFQLILLLKLGNLLSKSVFLTKYACIDINSVFVVNFATSSFNSALLYKIRSIRSIY